jgi:hypothetical protein
MQVVGQPGRSSQMPRPPEMMQEPEQQSAFFAQELPALRQVTALAFREPPSRAEAPSSAPPSSLNAPRREAFSSATDRAKSSNWVFSTPSLPACELDSINRAFASSFSLEDAHVCRPMMVQGAFSCRTKVPLGRPSASCADRIMSRAVRTARLMISQDLFRRLN